MWCLKFLESKKFSKTHRPPGRGLEDDLRSLTNRPPLIETPPYMYLYVSLPEIGGHTDPDIFDKKKVENVFKFLSAEPGALCRFPACTR